MDLLCALICVCFSVMPGVGGGEPRKKGGGATPHKKNIEGEKKNGNINIRSYPSSSVVFN